ncbi:MAG: DUF1570 domain-containing protein [Planctomycetota bacterium]
MPATTATISSPSRAGLAAALALGAMFVALIPGCAADSSPAMVAPQDAGAVAPAALGAVSPSDGLSEVPVERRPWSFAGYDGQIVITPHYNVYTTVSRRSVLGRLPLFLERGLVHYTTALGPLPVPSSRMETYLFDSRNEWEAKTRQMLPDQAGTFLTLGRGGFTTRGTSVLYYIGRSDTLAIAAHEGWHQYSQRALGNQIPLWLEEGIATYMEGYLSYPDGVPRFRPWANLERYHTLRRAARADRLIPLSELLRRTPQSFLADSKTRLLVYYAQVWALVHFLAEGEDGRYREALRRVLIDAAQGKLVERAGTAGDRRLGSGVLTTYFDSDLETFEDRYLQFVRRIVRTGGRNRVVQGHSPLSD